MLSRLGGALVLAALSISGVVTGCGAFGAGAMRDRMTSASTTLNPLGRGSLAATPIAVAKNGNKYRIIGADENEVCINGEVIGAPDDVAGITFVLKRFEAPDDDPALVPTVPSKLVKTLGTADYLGPQGERLIFTRFQTCFDNHEHILTPKTKYLVIHADVALGTTVAAAWHFDDELRGYGGMGLPPP